jgi:pyrroloquinoline quinone biosynthesis protein D
MADEPHVALAPMARLRWDKKDGRYLLLSPERGLVLNETASLVVQLCDGTRSGAALIEECVRKYGGASPERIEREVRALLAQLVARGLVVGYSEA